MIAPLDRYDPDQLGRFRYENSTFAVFPETVGTQS
jgi:hypothetical protein